MKFGEDPLPESLYYFFDTDEIFLENVVLACRGPLILKVFRARPLYQDIEGVGGNTFIYRVSGRAIRMWVVVLLWFCEFFFWGASWCR